MKAIGACSRGSGYPGCEGTGSGCLLVCLEELAEFLLCFEVALGGAGVSFIGAICCKLDSSYTDMTDVLLHLTTTISERYRYC